MIEFNTRARLWQESGGKGMKPKPIPLPGEKRESAGSEPEIIQRLRNLGMVPADASD